MTMLVTGGAGYIGSHTCVRLLEAGHQIAVIDNLCNSNIEAIHRIKQLTGKDFSFYQEDLRRARRHWKGYFRRIRLIPSFTLRV